MYFLINYTINYKFPIWFIISPDSSQLRNNHLKRPTDTNRDLPCAIYAKDFHRTSVHYCVMSAVLPARPKQRRSDAGCLYTYNPGCRTIKAAFRIGPKVKVTTGLNAEDRSPHETPERAHIAPNTELIPSALPSHFKPTAWSQDAWIRSASGKHYTHHLGNRAPYNQRRYQPVCIRLRPRREPSQVRGAPSMCEYDETPTRCRPFILSLTLWYKLNFKCETLCLYSVDIIYIRQYTHFNAHRIYRRILYQEPTKCF